MYLINGEWQASVPASDRGLQFGDGCFTTARILNGQVRFAEHHLARLQRDCQRLGIPAPAREILHTEMQQLAQQHDAGTLKVMITRGSGGRGYSPRGCDTPRRILSVSGVPPQYGQWRQDGIELVLSPVRLGCSPALAGVKHLNRLEQVLIRSHLEQLQAPEALVLDSDGMLVECCAANLFWRKQGVVYTPNLERAGVEGTMRRHILACLAAARWPVSEVREPPAALTGADEVVICNALMPIIPVKRIGQRQYTDRQLFDFLAPLCE
ncbi:aminodeoxychorismate lyase [Shimwellia blattae]|uniref:Aminodeoxychorismate lyase n=1 Tax=Shimwellia blattae (strain ATCC 29907 / DSM 4481 / JCM 1650 / NBRC 105725 / CDC 9005-74) TaxID=630626 RepID=I2BAD9_SHIBC|nr:aminodeoxychorismate lyase [Shimwellia blattae]AFJ47493.1 4-amino-4-deoxychorismate lyase [Shimwellia blattae DSM 4481 = NBRC 105725]GAB80316.1 aminodeoxychorismate lyase [Shimwellia blattae DSM 4481 = NBRC 105725]VDY64990.1 Aminodeoxychorismate lyase [Shimwellia blattae]VEC23286.1 Aminodeoxychorismate lyase [Shimwellia blattae]